MESSYALPIGPAGVHSHHHHSISTDHGSPKYSPSSIIRKESSANSLRSPQSNGHAANHSHARSHHRHDHSHDHFYDAHQHIASNSQSFSDNDRFSMSGISLDGAATAYPKNASYGIPSVGKTAQPVTPHSHAEAKHSALTSFLLARLGRYPFFHTILSEKDSRRIFYFTILNFSFMLVQTFYGIATGSLGLLSDSIHMLFDCLALVVGLGAAVMSKWPPSMRFPYGLGKMDTLAGFANGVFLMLISVEIITEAIERLAKGNEMHRIGELLIVSVLGLCVNAVGIFAFDHAHAHHGHDHGHSHGHSHSHHSGGHSHDLHSHSHSHNHAHQQSCNHSHPTHAPSPLNPSFNSSNAATTEHSSHNHKHHHHHHNDNMQGIYLHIMADLMGSAAVTVSTILVYFYKWSGFDPLASCVIAVLIFISAIPLVKSSAQTLLLTIPADTEYLLRETLSGVSGLRGVVGYTVPRFWLEDQSVTNSRKEEEQKANGTTTSAEGEGVLGVIHVIASRSSDVLDVRQRTSDYLRGRGLNVVVQVEKEGEGRCWCGGGLKSG